MCIAWIKRLFRGGGAPEDSDNFESADGIMKMIIGLGNPGTKYAGTRHNIGWDAVTALADANGIALKTKECKCVRALMDFYKVSEEDILVICDEVSLATGRLRIRAKGSAGGHNGMKSIIQHVGTSDFARLRIGVGEKPEGWELADHVLAHFPKEEEPGVIG